MEVISVGSLPVASLLWQPRPGAWMFTFFCKATYSLRPGESPLAEEQQPLNKADRYWHDIPTNSLMAPSDITPLRPRTDVVLVGSAFAPGGAPLRSLVARLVVADIDKRIEVYCDRLQNRSGAIQEGAPFSQMSLAYERAAGGPDSANPVGMRPDAWDTNGNRRLPNVQAPGSQRQGTMNRAEVEGFGPIAPTWPSRRFRLGQHAASWSEASLLQQPLPDFDRSYFNTAPSDQQTQRLEDNARITLENLHPEHAQLVTSLPGIHPHAFIRRPDRIPESAQIGIDLLWIHTDKAVCTLTWRGQVPLDNPQEDGVVMVAVENPGEKLMWDDVARLMVRGASAVAGSGARFGGVGETVAPPVATSAAPAVNPLKGTAVPSPNAGASGNVTPFAKQLGEAAPSGQAAAAAQRLAATPFARPGEPPPHNPESTGSWNVSPRAPPPGEAPLARTEPPPPPVSAPPATPPSFGAPPVTPPSFGAQPVPPPSFGAQPPAMVAPPAPVATPPMASAPPADSPWASGPSAKRETIGMQAALEASNAAADDMNRRAEPAASAPEPRPRVPREVLKLLWFDPKAVARIRKHAEWRIILAELELRLLEEEGPAEDEEEAPEGAAGEPASKARRDVFEVLIKGRPVGPEGVKPALNDAIGADGKFEPPLILLAGELELPFDQLATLKAIASAVSPFAVADKKLKDQLDVTEELLKTPWLQGSGSIAEGLTDKLKEAFAQGKRPVGTDYLASHAERNLLEQRCYQMRTVFGKRWIRSLLGASGVPVYLPEALKDELPMFKRVKVKLIGEVDMQEDQYESGGCAIKAVALGRVMG